MHSDLLSPIAGRVRRQVIEWSHRAGTPHLGSSLSCVDLLVALYWAVLRIDPREPDHVLRDRFVLSKGHAALALYVTLAERGFFPATLLDTYNQDGGRLAEHPGPHCAPGVEAATGSLGHGLPLGAGMALSGRIQEHSYRVFVLLSDGECNEGSVWEAAMFAAAQRLDNLVAIVDYNKWQATGRSDEVLGLAPLRAKWEAFGWCAVEVDGHDYRGILGALKQVPNGTGKPMAIVAHTIKGRGVSFMEDDNNWHYRIPSADEVRRAAQELKVA
jgi:transketolase